ncbi:MAG: AAA family ATPase [Candidatus Odinarchaeum yellowstonii]|uniref:Cytidylate kinase n=1 Tax=Odinarchaeota yellowstonii (strain LCB_4) TaxID=1841599 RepID=A0AAF0IAS1_ODILC|nr:MAG: AAA family ATPase [Candidatus Odinarchaeum yellowstonii]
MKLVICISGSAGTGKTTQAKIIAKKYGLKYASAGSIFRDIAKERGLSLEQLSAHVLDDTSIDVEIDKRTRKLAEEGNIVLEGRLTAWMTKGIDAFRIYLKCPLETEIRRVAERDRKSLAEARTETLSREESERIRYKKLYGIDISDLSIYDIVLNTDIYPIESVTRILITAIDEYISNMSKR